MSDSKQGQIDKEINMDERLTSAVDELQALAKGKDLREIRELVKRFDAAISSGDGTAARAISKEALTLEKIYVPQIPENDRISQELNCENMIMTVGFQKEPIILSILCMKPRKVILLHTDGSRPTALAVETDPDIQSMGVEITPLFITEYDASENYRIIKEQALPRVLNVEKTVIDPTAGRKVMVASLALAAFYMRFPMVYIHGIEQGGVVFPFTERLRFIENPFDVFGDTELDLIQEQFNCHLYEAAINTCKQLERKVRDGATLAKVSHVRKLIEVYLDWDAFLHSSVRENRRLSPLLNKRLEHIMAEFDRLGYQEHLPDNVEANLEFLKKLDDTWRNKQNIVDKFRLADIFASALRREKQKKYDDAVARLYRCLEMCSAIRLIELGLADPAEPDYEAFSSRIGKTTEWIKNEFKKRKHRELPLEKLALDNQMTLLGMAGEDIANIYEDMKRKEGGAESLMDIRNRSILAHGTNPVPEDRWPRFKAKTEAIIRKTMDTAEFERLLAMAVHGELHIGGGLHSEPHDS